MAAHQATATLRIDSGETQSSSLVDFWGVNPAKVALDHAAGVVISAPAALTGTATVEISPDGTYWVTLQNAGTDVELPAGKATVLPPFTAKDLRIVSGGAEADDRDFFVTIQEEIP